MSRRKLLAYVITLVAAFGLLTPMGYFFWTHARGVYVSITNNTSDPLQQVEIAYTGGVIQIAMFQPKTSRGWHINPTDEVSVVTLKWVDSSGKEHSHVVNTYIERGYTGSLEIVVEPDNMVSFIDKTRPYFF